MKSNEYLANEKPIENRLIEHLTHGNSQWTSREDLKTVPKLWDNFFTILERHNQKPLEGVSLTQVEKDKIKAEITQSNFYKSAEFMIGANQKVSYHLDREDSTLPSADLLILDNENISKKSAVYEIVHQVELTKKASIEKNRRFDVSFLINGLPFIHMEMKQPGKPYKKAFNQIQDYINEGQFTDIYCFVKMFVVTNGTHTKYISASQKLNSKFLISWADNNNKTVNNYLDFGRDVLSTYAAHHMVADYNVLDAESKKIIMLRPYQIHAIKAIVKSSQEGKSGFIWHTTGSGKTLTSYKVAQNLLKINSIDKTIFLIDRKDLDSQTSNNFKAYAENDIIKVNNNISSFELADQLNNHSRDVIITTKQKLQVLFKRINDNSDEAQKFKKLKNKRFAFVVDECHRTVSPSQKRELDRFFNRKQLWYGFTGTPRFKENALKENGQAERTTEQLYGPCLHAYTIENALKDKTVLPFQVEILGNKYESMSREDIDKTYLSTSHMKTVVNKMLQMSFRKQGFAHNQHYAALLITSSIGQAQEYYKLIKEAINDGCVPMKIKQNHPNFPRIGITYSVTENDDNSIYDQNEMKASLNDYNETFGQSFNMGNLDAYNQDVINRLAGKHGRFLDEDNQLDIVIVVNRLLTGFDAPRLSTLYIDRKPMQPQNIIQAISRTNRLFDKNKRFGQIVTFQYPDEFDKAIDDALILYSNGGGAEARAPKWEESKKHYVQSQSALGHFIAKYNDIADIVDADEEEQFKFTKLFRMFVKDRTAIQTYDRVDEETLPDFTSGQFDIIRGSYANVVQQLKDEAQQDDESVDLNYDYELELFHSEEINFRYLLDLMNSCVPTNDDESVDLKSYEQVKNQIAQMSEQNPKLSNMLGAVWKEFTEHPLNYKNMDIGDVLHLKAVEQVESILSKFTKDYSVDYNNLKYVFNKYEEDLDEVHQEGMTQLLTNNAYDNFKNEHPSSEIYNQLKWIKAVRESIKNVYKDKIKPLYNMK